MDASILYVFIKAVFELNVYDFEANAFGMCRVMMR